MSTVASKTVSMAMPMVILLACWKWDITKKRNAEQKHSHSKKNADQNRSNGDAGQRKKQTPSREKSWKSKFVSFVHFGWYSSNIASFCTVKWDFYFNLLYIRLLKRWWNLKNWSRVVCRNFQRYSLIFWSANIKICWSMYGTQFRMNNFHSFNREPMI